MKIFKIHFSESISMRFNHFEKMFLFSTESVSNVYKRARAYFMFSARFHRKRALTIWKIHNAH